jgi:putative peptide zinc metalloprotease protein
MTTTDAVPALTDGSTVGVTRLGYRCERDSWTVGSLDTGEAIDVPAIAVTVLRALEQGKTIGTAADIAEQEHGERPDVCSFVTDLAELGFIRITAQTAPVCGTGVAESGSSLQWLKARHVSLAFHPATVTVASVLIVCAFCLAAAAGRLDLSYRSVFISRYPAVVIAWSACVMALTAMLHEFSHLAAARVAGIPARISLSSRLIFLTPQTAAPLLWLASRRDRFRFYLAGTCCDVTFAAGCALTTLYCRTGTLPAKMASAAMLMLILGIASEFLFCMRTDIYLVVQELTRCRNLFGDARAYGQYLTSLVRALATHRAHPADPTADLPAHEQWPVRVYCAFMVIGSAALVALTAAYGLPLAVVLYVRAAHELVSGQALRVLDGAVTFIIDGSSNLLLARLLALRWARRPRTASQLAAADGS